MVTTSWSVVREWRMKSSRSIIPPSMHDLGLAFDNVHPSEDACKKTEDCCWDEMVIDSINWIIIISIIMGSLYLHQEEPQCFTKSRKQLTSGSQFLSSSFNVSLESVITAVIILLVAVVFVGLLILHCVCQSRRCRNSWINRTRTLRGYYNVTGACGCNHSIACSCNVLWPMWIIIL